MTCSSAIVVNRPAGVWRDVLRSYVIKIDGSRAGRVKRGKQIRIPIEPGTYRVRATIDWTGSRELTVSVQQGRDTSLMVSPAGTSFELWLGVSRTKYLILEDWSGASPPQDPAVGA